MGKTVPLQLNTRALLDTAMPVTDREPGTLVTAREINSKYWGPREGSVAFTRVTRGDGNGFLNGYVNLTGAACEFAAESFEDSVRDLGTKWTIDLWFRLTDHTYSQASGKDFIPVHEHETANGHVRVSLVGPSDATNVGKVYVSILNTSSRGVASASTYTQRGSVAVSEGTTQDKDTHVRVVRDGNSLTIFTNGVVNTVGATSGTLVATEGLYENIETAVAYRFAHQTDTPYADGFKGRIIAGCLRDGAFDSYPIESSFPHNFRGRNVHYFMVSRRITDGSVPHVMDLSRCGNHFVIREAGYTVTSANDEDHPVPAPVQGIGSWVTLRGQRVTAAMIGGRLHRKQVS